MHNAVHHNDTQHSDIQHNDIRHDGTQHNAILHNAVYHNDTQHNDIQRITALGILKFSLITLNYHPLLLLAYFLFHSNFSDRLNHRIQR
jgi:hypothetical protein